MKSWLRWILIVTGTVLVALVLLRQHYVLSSAKLDEAIKAEVPVGSSKDRVVNFIPIRHPVAYDDMGIQVEARLQGLAENMIYRKDIVLTFEFSPDGKLAMRTRTRLLRIQTHAWMRFHDHLKPLLK